jgi:hypothetical protein
MTGGNERDDVERKDLSELVESRQSGVLAEFWLFLKYNKKWWLLPLLLALLLLGLLVILSGSGLAPFIYPFA